MEDDKPAKGFEGRSFLSLLDEVKAAFEPTGKPVYVYYITGEYEFVMLFAFRGGGTGLALYFLEDRLMITGTMEFNAAAEWNDAGIERSGWIYTISTGTMQPSTMFFADYASEEGYALYATTLPYTPGQPPSVASGTYWLQRWTTGPGQSS
jgi:hypothetical protein